MRDFLAFVSLFAEKPPRTAWASLVRRFADGIYQTSAARYFVRGMFASGWEPLALFAERDPVPSVPHVWDRSRQWAWRNRHALSSMRSRLKTAYGKVVPSLESKVDFREVFEVFSKVALGSAMRYSVGELVPEKKLWEEALHRPLTHDEACQYALKRVELFFRYAEAVYRNDPRTLAQVLAEDGQKLFKLKEADLLVGDEKIVISTIHKAKGRQFDAVIVPDADEMIHSGLGAGGDEARRLLYVAMSRAKRHLTLYSKGVGKEWQGLQACFRSGYESYYLRRAKGSDLSQDWLNQWEALAKVQYEGRCPMDLVEPALQSNSDPVVRMALKVLRHHPNRDEAIRRWQGFLTTPYADTSMGCLQHAQVYDAETIRLIREAALTSEDESAHRAALAYFEAGAEVPSDCLTELAAAIGDFLYHRDAALRLDAATLLDARGLSRWRDIVRGASADFDRLQRVADDAHEETIRTILTKKLPDDYERRLRTILFARATLRQGDFSFAVQRRLGAR